MAEKGSIVSILVALCVGAVVGGLVGHFGFPQKQEADKATMEAHCVVPDLIPVAPPAKLTVNFPSGVSAEMGAELTPTQVKDQPEVSWEADNSALYTLIMADPDVPQRTGRTMEVRHWLVQNIPGSRLADGDEVTQYIGSGAPQGTGFHRYLLLVYKQPGTIAVNDTLKATPSEIDPRMNWNTHKFAEEMELGTPVAGNLFRAQWDEYVPELHEQLGFNP